VSNANASPALFGVAALALAAAVGGAAPAAAQPRGQEGLYVRNINGFNAPNDHTVYVRGSANEIWRIDLMTDCTGLSFRHDFRLRSAGGDPWICQPIQAEVSFRDIGIPQRCPVVGLHRLSPEEAANLPRRLRP